MFWGTLLLDKPICALKKYVDGSNRVVVLFGFSWGIYTIIWIRMNSNQPVA